MAFETLYLLKNTILVLSRGVAFAHFFSPIVGHLQLVPQKMTIT